MYGRLLTRLSSLFIISLITILSCTNSSNVPGSKSSPEATGTDSTQESPFKWPDGKKAAISLTFDDARLSQPDRGFAVFDAYGMKATFFVNQSGIEARLERWKEAIINGHEIANHTLNHPCTGNYPFARRKALEDCTLDEMAYELDEGTRVIEQLLGVTPKTFAYPCGQKFVGRGKKVKSYVPLVAERFLVGRGWLDEGPNDPTFCDLSQTMGMELDGLTFEEVKPIIDQAIANGHWLIFCGHEIGDPGKSQTTLVSTVDAICRYAQDPAHELWLDTVANIGEHIRSHN
ncbi:MAG: polysaccharide deacetylase family protein [Fidelibacterota bacterium]|nr:MAG: polysaccharide deacetylase family protein [Candidatus Neomarinimicrobiota bacterium]